MVDYSRNLETAPAQHLVKLSKSSVQNDESATASAVEKRPAESSTGLQPSLIGASHGETISQGRRSLFRR